MKYFSYLLSGFNFVSDLAKNRKTDASVEWQNFKQ